MRRGLQVFCCGAGLALGGCLFSGGDEPEMVPAAPENPAATAGDAESEDCHRAKPDLGTPPFFLKEQKIVVTRIMKPCVTKDGASGFAKGTSWIAMGYPCTGGGGRIEWKGHYAKPKMISFSLSNSCAMTPAGPGKVSLIGHNVIGLDSGSKLIGYYPFALQYWELVDYPDADTGHVVELRSPTSITRAWEDFRKNIPLKVRFYGRENSWVRGRYLFYAEAEIHQTSRQQFRLHLISVKPLDDEELQKVRARCEALQQPRKCLEAFTH